MKYIIAIALFYCFTIGAWAQNLIQIFAYNTPLPISNFENRDAEQYFFIDTAQVGNIWQIGTPSKPTNFTSAYSPTLALMTDTLSDYPANNTSSFEFEIYTDDATTISFWHKYDTDSLLDGGMVEVSMDGGQTWQNVVDIPFVAPLSSSQWWLHNFYTQSDTVQSLGSPGFSGKSNGWINSQIQGFAMYNYRFRFTFASDAVNNNKAGWMLDDFNFICVGTSVTTLKDNGAIKVYPNPVVHIITIELEPSIELEQYTIYNSFGQQVATGNNLTVNCSEWTKGIYLMEIHTNKGVLLKEIIK